MKKFTLIVMLFCSMIAFGQKDYSVSFEQPKGDIYQLNFDITHWDVQPVVFDGVQYQQIIFSRSTVTEEKGWAELPFVTASVQLPAQKNVDLSVVYTEYQDIPLSNPLVPSRGTIYRNQDPSTIPYQIDKKSLVNKFYPETMAVAEDPFIIRDVRGTTVTIYPFQWNAVTNTLRVYTKMTVTLTENNQPAFNPLLKENANPIREVRGMYKSIFINYAEPKQALTMAEYGDILVITTERDEEAIQPYIDWKLEKGYNVEKEVVATGTNVESLVREKYEANNNLMYVLLVGDWADIKCKTMSSDYVQCPTDPMLGDVAGNANDYRPDLSVGRMSANNPAHVTTQVNKAIQYERNPNMDAAWYGSFIGLGSNDYGQADDNERDWMHIQRIYDQRLVPAFGYHTHGRNYENESPYPNAANLATQINTGASTIAYCGHGSANSFVTTGFSNSHVNQLTNGQKMPFIVSVACVNGAFHNSSDCFAEAWLRKENGGAVVTWMSTINQSWSPPMRGQDYFYDILIGGFDYTQYPGQNGINTEEQRTHWGSIVVNAANLMLSESNSTSDKETVRTWCTFGDPSLQLRTKFPEVITSSNEVVTPELNYETTITDAEGNPVEGALVCLSQDSVYVKGFTDAEGNIALEHPFLEGEVLLVVTAFNTTTIYKTLALEEQEELPIPMNLQFTVTNANHVELTWEEPEEITAKNLEITGYNVYRNDELITPEPVREDAFSLIDIVEKNGAYVYEVTALYGEKESEECEPVTVIIDGMCVPFSEKITIEQTDGHNILVSWTAPEYEGLELAGYNVYRQTEKVNTELITELSYLDENLAPDYWYCYHVEVVYNDCEETFMSEAECLSVVGIEESSKEMFRIFPNPAHSELTLTSNVVPQNVTLYNITGQQVYSNDHCNKEMRISVESFNPGVYFLKINSEQGAVTKKVIIN